MKISVIIPTIGRESLKRSVQSVLNQTLQAGEILIVVDESKCDIQKVNSLLQKSELVRVIRSSGSGVSAARNSGVSNSVFELVAFLDDDDEWVEKKLESQMNTLTSRNLNQSDRFLLSSRTLYIGPNTCFLQPIVVYEGTNILKAIYNLSWQRVRVCLPTPTFLLPRWVAHETKFDERLVLREDIMWMYQLEIHHVKIIQTNEVLSLVSYDPVRSRENESIFALLQTFRSIREFNTLIALKFFFGVGFRSLALKYVVRFTKSILQR